MTGWQFLLLATIAYSPKNRAHAKAVEQTMCKQWKREAASLVWQRDARGSNWLNKVWKVGKCEDWSVLFGRYNVAGGECG
uniref:Putative secreted protein n=1 Tax=Anopheles marajoara TaxID=58244 RepID=A0A2M4CBZ8_9DIPT